MLGVILETPRGFLLLLMLVHLLHALTLLPLWSCYGIVGGVLVLSELIVLFMEQKTAKEIAVVPETMETLKENTKWIKNQTAER